MRAPDRIKNAALAQFDTHGWDAMTIAAICAAAGVSNGSFFHAFATKEALGAELYLDALESYHGVAIEALDSSTTAKDGIRLFIEAHLAWVVENRTSARLLFEQARADWLTHVRARQTNENSNFIAKVRNWQDGHPVDSAVRSVDTSVLLAQLIGPAQIFCRAWLSGRSDIDPRSLAPQLTTLACRALV